MIHDSVVIRGNVEIGERVTIEPYAIITGPCVIGDDSYIGAHAMIGGAPQHRGSYPSSTRDPMRMRGVEIGADSCVREYATIHHGVIKPTRIGDRVLIMSGTHVAHDSTVGSGATIGSFSIFGGFTIIDHGVTFGQGVVTHPWTVIGEHAMVGLNSSVLKDVLPFQKVAGAPAKPIGMNRHKHPELPNDYEASSLSVDVWDRWSDLLQIRMDDRAEWERVEA
ncbi:MAG: acyl-ACP--UDP-N- acetylglucosamine O-acyltransferase [Ilumatobacteraceae bacterium]